MTGLGFSFNALVGLLVSSLVILWIYQRVTGVKITWKQGLIFPLILLSYQLLVTGSPALGFAHHLHLLLLSLTPLVAPLALTGLSWRWDGQSSKTLHIFYGFYPVVIVSLVFRFFFAYIFPFVELRSDWASGQFYLVALVYLLILLLHEVLVRSVLLDFVNLRKILGYEALRRWLIFINVTMLLYCLTLMPVVDWISPFSGGEHRRILIPIYLMVFVLLLIYINRELNRSLEQALDAQKEQQLQDMAAYSDHIESLYQEIRSFRHDYANILISLKLAIEEGDMETVRQVYDDVLAKTEQKFQQGHYDLSRLINLEDDAIKSILSAKLLEAQNAGLTVDLEIGEKIGRPNMDLLDFITVLSIFLDNAIQEASQTENGRLTVAYFQAQKSKVLIVENSTRQASVNIRQIFQPGFSTKGTNRGIGLPNVRAIVDADRRVTLQTSSRNHQLRHVLEVRD